MKLYVIKAGFLETAGANLYPGEPDVPETVRMPVMCYLIDTGSGWILYDTGCHPEAANGHWYSHHLSVFYPVCREEERLENQLAKLGLKPEDIRTIVLSHLHLDHMGNIHLFRHADIYVPEADFLYGQTLVRLQSDVKTHSGYIKAELDVPVKQYHLVREDCQLVPGVELVNLPGHTPGLLGLVVHLDGGTVILPQDCLYAEWNYLPQARASGNMYDRDAFFASIEKVRALQKKYNAAVFYAHDEAFYQNIRMLPEYYE